MHGSLAVLKLLCSQTFVSQVGPLSSSMSKSVLFFAVLLLTVFPVAPDRRTIPLPLPLTVLERTRVR